MSQVLTRPERVSVMPLNAWRWEHLRWRIFAVLVVVYALMSWGVLVRSPLISLDRATFNFALTLRTHHSQWYPFLNTYVLFGQRRPGMMTALPFVIWLTYRARNLRPLLVFVIALLILNLSVGFVKIGIGRLGPTQTHSAYTVFAGGDIFPSGHVSNAVVLFGILAMMSTRFQKQMIVLAVFLSFTVGLSTVYLGTHWISDVVAGWIAGVLVLLVLPTVVPWVEAMLNFVFARVLQILGITRYRARRAAGSVEADPGQVRGPLPEPRGEGLVAGGARRVDPLRVPVHLPDPVRTGVGPGDSFRGRRGEQGRQRTPVGALRQKAVADRHDQILD
jgi:membrane-associated phospholipid phosphatase